MVPSKKREKKKVGLGRMRATLALTLILMMLAHTSAAAEDDCTVHDKYGETRDCSFTEDLADCVLDAGDSYDQCVEDGGFLNWVGCELTNFADNAACIVSTTVEWGLGRLF